MAFTWPLALLSLLLVPLLVAGYVVLMRRRGAAPGGDVARVGAMRLTEGASGRRVGWRRHLAPALFLAALALLLVSLARPTAVVALPHREGTVILAFDVSSSMLADDLKPSRMEAAKAAASAFVRKQPSTIRVGVVVFSDSAFVTQQPTNVQADVLAAIDRIQPQGGTSLSAGMLASLGAIAGKPIVLDEPTPAAGATPAAPAQDAPLPDIGYFGSAAIVLLSDGEDTTRTDPLTVADLAAGAGVRVFPIGIGSPEGTTVELEGYTVATALNESLLSDIATATDGTYYRAEDEAQLAKIYDTIDLKLTVKGERVEITSLFAGAAMLLLVVGAGFTMRWFGRVP